MAIFGQKLHFGKGFALLLATFLHLIFQQKNALKSRKLKENDILVISFQFNSF